MPGEDDNVDFARVAQYAEMLGDGADSSAFMLGPSSSINPNYKYGSPEQYSDSLP